MTKTPIPAKNENGSVDLEIDIAKLAEVLNIPQIVKWIQSIAEDVETLRKRV